MRRPDGRPAISPRAVRRSVVVSLVTGVGVLAAFAAVVRDGDETIRQLQAVKPAWVAFAAVLTVAAWLIRSWRSAILVDAMGSRIRVSTLFRYYLSSVFVSHVTPTSTGGLPVFVYLLARHGMNAGQATAVAVVDSGLVVIWLLLGWPLATLDTALGSGIRPGAVTAAVVLALATVALFTGVTLTRPRSWARLFMPLLRRWRRSDGRMARLRGLTAGLVRESLRFSRAVEFLVRRKPWPLLEATILTGLYWAVYLSIAWSVLRGLGARVDWWRVAVAQFAFNVVQPFIPTPGGSGGAELLMAYLFRGVLPVGRLALFVGVWRFFTFYASLATGGLMFVRTLGAVARPAPSSGSTAGDVPGSPGGRHRPAPAEPPP